MGCGLDRRADIDEINAQYLGGVSLRSISHSTGVPLTTCHRHKTCIRDLIRERQQGERTERSLDLVGRCEELISETREILTAAKSKQDFAIALKAVGTCARLLELLGHADGSLQAGNSGSLHLTLNSTKVTVDNYSDDREIAILVAEATDQFNAATIERLRALACTDDAPTLPTR